MPPRLLDFRIEAKLVATLKGQGGTDALAGLAIPVTVTGPRADPWPTSKASGFLPRPSHRR